VRDFAAQIGRVEGARLRQADCKAILGDNAARLLGIPAP